MKVRGILKQSGASFLVANIVFVLTFLGNIFLVRMLLPEDFGTLAFVTSLVGLIEIFTSFSLGTVLIQQSHRLSLLRTIFQFAFFVLGLKLILATVFFIVLQGRYDNLVWTLFTLIITSKAFACFGPLLVSQLDKRGDFLYSTLVTSGSTLISVIAAIFAVLCGAGLYGLLLREVLPPVLVFVAMVIFFPQLLPNRFFKFNQRGLRVVAVASTRLYFQRCSELAFARVPFLLIESIFGTSVLGLYAQATNLVTLVNRITGIINQQVASVFFSRNRRDVQETRSGFLLLIRINMILALPAIVLLFFFPNRLILFLWNENWLGAVDYLKLMAPMTFLLPLFTIFKSRLLGLRNNQSITAIYALGFIFFLIGLWFIQGISDSANWLAGLTTAAYALMVILSARILWFSVQTIPSWMQIDNEVKR